MTSCVTSAKQTPTVDLRFSIHTLEMIISATQGYVRNNEKVPMKAASLGPGIL